MDKKSTGNYSTGNYSTGDSSTGNYSTGNYSTGDRSTGYRSTGHFSMGCYSTGNCSTGSWSTGNCSTGSWSTGSWSTSNYSTGHFSTIDYMGLSLFNKPITIEEWEKQIIPDWCRFSLTEWVKKDHMTDEEKKDHPTYETTGGYLKVYDYKEAFQKSYHSVSREEQLKIKDVLHFDADIFYEISGIKIDEESMSGKSIKVIIDGKEYDAIIQ